jgi:tRNA pseudouridine13 synthase
MLLAGSERQFAFDPADTSIPTRLAELDVHPSGPLFGRSSRALQACDRVAELESLVCADWQAWAAGLERFGLDADRRSLRLAVRELQWNWSAAGLRLSFSLTAGAYATAVLRELVLARSDDI